jgi:hypothetical protein
LYIQSCYSTKAFCISLNSSWGKPCVVD